MESFIDYLDNVRIIPSGSEDAYVGTVRPD